MFRAAQIIFASGICSLQFGKADRQISRRRLLRLDMKKGSKALFGDKVCVCVCVYELAGLKLGLTRA